MKLEKKHWILIATIAVIIAAVYWFFFRKKATESNFSVSSLKSDLPLGRQVVSCNRAVCEEAGLLVSGNGCCYGGRAPVSMK